MVSLHKCSCVRVSNEDLSGTSRVFLDMWSMYLWGFLFVFAVLKALLRSPLLYKYICYCCNSLNVNTAHSHYQESLRHHSMEVANANDKCVKTVL